MNRINFLDCNIFLTKISLLFLLMNLVSLEAFGKSSHLNSRAIPPGLYHNCKGGGLGKFCAATVTRAWNEGHFKSFTTKLQSYTDGVQGCTLSYWTDSKEPVIMVNPQQVGAALEQIDQKCVADGMKVAELGEKVTDFEGIYVGKLSGKHVAIEVKVKV
ncbi:hypothetical protein BY996DRAFT_7103654 [Phakopsora pachyrhizi]|uniref:Expressed protein n=1 Tax=Phakopsora pachyrhizi TaxID=170000 RepID=A0AAV0AJW3_PHAPC|nr:hypothetical protein BY996DRAFT_4216071 [Phakopsora pachyrhizi]KAI8454321.1 hypothetical protein BY996DRAFT_7103654 [Phakopsora pachyrhizi]CAH7668590.1 expressed protein [Phakopsora pachyrhizi]